MLYGLAVLVALFVAITALLVALGMRQGWMASGHPLANVMALRWTVVAAFTAFAAGGAAVVVLKR